MNDEVNSSPMPETIRLVEVIRGDVVESHHRGVVAAVDCHGSLLAAMGDADRVTFMRSCAKPFQAIPLITRGGADRFGVTPAELALTAGSHSGQPIHVQAVEALLQRVGLTPAALRCGAHPPFDPESARNLNGSPSALHNNCSGKHTGMLALASHLGAPLSSYDHPTHIVQQEILEAVSTFSSVDRERIGLGEDGCGVPTFALPVRSIAFAYARLVAPDRSGLPEPLRSAARRVTDAMIAYPEMVGGTHGRFDTDLMRAMKGNLISKVGAEGVQAIAVFPTDRYPEGLGLVVKIADGDGRKVRGMVALEALRQLDLIGKQELAQMNNHGPRQMRNHRGDLVGWIRPAFTLNKLKQR